MKRSRSMGRTLVYGADFSAVANGYKSYNAKSQNGCLVSERNLQTVEVAYACFDCDGFFLTFNDQGVYSKIGNVRRKIAETVTKNPTLLFIEQLKIAAISCEEGTFTCDGTALEKISDLQFSRLVFSHERLFGVHDGVLFFAARDDFQTWKTVQLAGVGSVCVAGDVFAIGNDVVKVDFSDSETDVKITTVFRNVGSVQPRSVGVFGSKIFFATQDCLKCYRNSTCETIAENFHFENAVGAVVGGKYFVSAIDCDGASCVLCVDCATKKVESVLSIEVNLICGCNFPYFCTDSAVLTFGEDYSDLFWQSNSVDFDTSCKKYFRKLCVDTEFPLEVQLVTERDCKIYRFDGAQYSQRVNVSGYFKKMQIKLSGQGQTKINCVKVFVQTFESEVPS